MRESTQLLIFAGSVLVGHYGGFELWLSYMLITVLFIAMRTSENAKEREEKQQ